MLKMGHVLRAILCSMTHCYMVYNEVFISGTLPFAMNRTFSLLLVRLVAKI